MKFIKALIIIPKWGSLRAVANDIVYEPAEDGREMGIVINHVGSSSVNWTTFWCISPSLSVTSTVA